MPEEVKFPIKVDGIDELNKLVSVLKAVAAAQSTIKESSSSSSSSGRGADIPRGWKSGRLPGGMSPSDLYMGGQAGSVAKGIMRAPSGGGGGGGMANALGLGAVAGMAAAGIMLLVKVLKDALSQSKIASAFANTLNKLLGLLIDVILLPFLPILIIVILGLTSGILALHNLISGLTPATVPTALTTKPINDVGQAAIGPVGFDIGRWIGENFTDKIIQSFIDGYQKIVAAAQLTWTQWVNAFNLTWAQWSKAFNDDWNALTGWINTNVVVPIEKLWKGIADWFDTNVTTPVKNLWKGIVDSLTGWFTNLYNNPLIKWLTSNLGSSSTTAATTTSSAFNAATSGVAAVTGAVAQNTVNIFGIAANDVQAVGNAALNAFYRLGQQSPGGGSQN